jgi:cob(I)alamin adenosyltransferase
MHLNPRIYTRSGDTGDTGLFGGQRVSKDHPRIEAYGTVDELNAALGLARAQTPDAEMDALLAAVQRDLFTLGSDLATPDDASTRKGKIVIERLTPADTERLEQEIDRYQERLPPLTAFILPGGSPLAAALHLARVVCRRAERRCVELSRQEAVNPGALRYLNRLSDLLFVLARAANHRQGVSDVLWKPTPDEQK